MPSVAARYAEALVGLSAEENAMDQYQEELSELSGIFRSNHELRTFLLDPGTDTKIKKEAITGIFKEHVQTNVLHFLLLLLDKDRMSLLPDICRDFVDMADAKRNIKNITITSSTPLEQSKIDDICNRFKELLHCSRVKADVQIDASLIGGVKVAAGDTIYDGTVKGRLSGLRSVLF